MIPASPRIYRLQGKGGDGRNLRICTAALWSNCHCPRCRPDIYLPPASGATVPAPEAAAVRVIPPAADGGTSNPSDDALVVRASLDPAADRNPPLSGDPVGGLFGDPQ